MGITLALLLLAVVAACGKSTTKTTDAGSSTTAAGAVTTAAGGATTTTTGGAATGKGTLKLTVSGGLSGTIDGAPTFSGCGVLGTNGYRVTATAKLKGHTVELRIGVNGKVVNGSLTPYSGNGDYTFNRGVEGHFEDQDARVRWSDDEGTSGPGGTVTIKSDTEGTFDITMWSAPFKSTDPKPAASTVHLVGSWSC